MTWSVAKTWDMPASTLTRVGASESVSPWPDALTAMWEELFDVWLPSRGHVTRLKPGFPNQRGWIAYHRDAATGVDKPQYFWVSWTVGVSSNSLIVFEDATYTSVPGDLMTDTGNDIICPGSHTDTQLDNNFCLPYRLWVSDEEPNNFLLTHGGKLFLGWVKMPYREFASAADPETAPGGVRRRETQIFPLSKDLKFVNGPLPASSVEFQISWPCPVRKWLTDNAAIYTNVNGIAVDIPLVTLDASDVGFWIPKGSDREDNVNGEIMPQYRPLAEFNKDYFYRVLVDNTAWWLIYGPLIQLGDVGFVYETNIHARLAFKCSALKPPAP